MTAITDPAAVVAAIRGPSAAPRPPRFSVVACPEFGEPLLVGFPTVHLAAARAAEELADPETRVFVIEGRAWEVTDDSPPVLRMAGQPLSFVLTPPPQPKSEARQRHNR